jgi:ATP-dependent exoDNAse (exonuclease V) beta subunit
VAVIAADPDVPVLAGALDGAGMRYGAPGSDARLTLVPVTLAKGLEYDHVIVVEPARIASAEARGLHRLYVALTRAVSRLTVLHAEPLPSPLSSSS